MQEYWKETFYGHVTVTITGKLLEQFINRCVKEGLLIWDIRRLNNQSITCKVSLNDIKPLKRILKESKCKIHFRERKGFPFFLKRFTSRKGVIAGFVVFLAVLFLLSNMIWTINVSGADPKLEHKIRTLLANMDYQRGSIQFFLPSVQQTEFELTKQLKQVTWVGVSTDGTTLNVKVVQKEIPKKEKTTGPQSLYATKEAIIHHLFVEKGQPMVKPDDYVKKGDLLVSGKIGTEEEPKLVASKGKVIGETWYHSSTSVPLVRHLVSFTGKSYEQDKVSLFGFEFSVWGFRKQNYKTEQVESIIKPFHFLRWTIPLSFNRYIHRETVNTTRTYTEAQAVEIGKRDARLALKDKLPEDSKIISENVWRKETDNGIVKLIINYVVNEDIAEAKPIIQGD